MRDSSNETDPTEIAPPTVRVTRSLRGEIRDAISARSALLVLGVLVLQLGFVLSYVGAFHAPRPQQIPVVVVAPTQVSPRLVAELNSLPAHPLRATAASDEAAARRLVTADQTSGALIVGGMARNDTLLVSSGGGPAVVTAIEGVTAKVEAAEGRTYSVVDVVPLQSGDGRGLTGFYLVIGWLVGGYLVAAAFGVAKGARPANLRRTIVRLLALVPYALASGIGGALIVDQVLGALTGHFAALCLLGSLLVYTAGAVTIALQILFDVLGIGVTVLLFVVLGNPSAGGAYQTSLLPAFWRTISGAIPNGAGVDVLRRIVYFGAHGITSPILVIAAYAGGGTLVAFVASTLRQRRQAEEVPAAEPSPAELPFEMRDRPGTANSGRVGGWAVANHAG